MNKLVLAVDIDDVLYPFSKHFLEYANKQLKSNKTITDMVSYRLDKLYDITYPEAIELIKGFMNQPYLLDILPIKDAQTAMRLLSGYFEIHIVTARMPTYANQTEAWIKKYFPNIFAEIHYCGFYATAPKNASHTTKGMLCNEIGAVCLIDDNADNIVDAITYGVEGVLFGEYAWHSELPKNFTPVRAKDWETIINRTSLLG